MAEEEVGLRWRSRGARAAQRDVDKVGRSTKQLDRNTRRLSRSQKAAVYTSTRLGGGLRVLTRGIGALTVGVGFLAGKVLVDAVKGWSEHLAVVRRTNAVIRSTGGAANVTAKHVDFLSQRIEKQTGVDNDIVQAGANLLLTFTNIRNGVGRNNKIFDEATAVVTNMSKALGQDTKSSAIQLGKALNDPIKGITALRRVGVSFTEDQQDQIKELVKAGKTMEAQRLILRELNKEFPKVKPTPWERVQTALRNIQDTLGKAILPAVNRFLRKITPGIEQFADDLGGVLDDKNLNWGQKLDKVGALLKRNFGPIIASWDIPGHIGRAFGYAAPRALDAFWTAFKNMPTKAKLITAALLATRLGLTAPLLGGVGRIMAGSIAGSFGRTLPARMSTQFAAGGAGALALGPAGKAMGVALGVGMLAYIASGGFKKSLSDTLDTVSNFVMPGFGKPNVPKGYQPAPGAAPYKRDSGPLRLQKPTPTPNAANPFTNAPPVIVQIDGKTVATAVERSSNKKKSTR